MTKFVDNTGIERCVNHINTLLGKKAGYKSVELSPRALQGVGFYTLAGGAYGGSITQIILIDRNNTSISSAVVTTEKVSELMQVGDRLVLVNCSSTKIAATALVYTDNSWVSSTIPFSPGTQLTLIKTSDGLKALTAAQLTT